jgi:hypothetical protein
MQVVPIPEGTVEYDGKVYRSQPWRGGFNALVLVGNLAAVKGEDGKPTGDRTFVPLAKAEEAADPRRAAQKAFQRAAQKATKAAARPSEKKAEKKPADKRAPEKKK